MAGIKSPPLLTTVAMTIAMTPLKIGPTCICLGAALGSLEVGGLYGFS